MKFNCTTYPSKLFCTTNCTVFHTIIFLVAMLVSSNCIAQVVFQDDFESGALNKTQNGFIWTESTGTQVVDFDGDKALRFTFQGVPDLQDSWAEQRFYLGNYYQDVWVQYDIYVPSNYYQRDQFHPGHDFSTQNDKSFLHIWTDDYGASNGIGAGFSSWSDGNGLGDLTFNQYYPQNPHVKDELRFPKAFESYELGKWTTITINIRAGTGNSDGLVKLWKNGQLTYELSANNHPSWMDMKKFLYNASGHNEFNNAYILGWSNSGYTNTTQLYVDNFVLSTTPLLNFDPPLAPVLQ